MSNVLIVKTKHAKLKNIDVLEIEIILSLAENEIFRNFSAVFHID